MIQSVRRFISTVLLCSVAVSATGYAAEQQTDPYHVDWKDKREILSCTDFLKLNEHEMAVIANSKNPRTVALQLAELGVKEVIITLGSYGSLIYADNRFYEIPAYKPREVVDATGCGDTYSAGYLYMRSLGADFEESGKFAAAMCTSKLEHNGPYDGKRK